jgi:hypothetical protein
MKGRLNRSFAMHTVEIGEYVYDRSMHIDGKAHIMGNSTACAGAQGMKLWIPGETETYDAAELCRQQK